MDPIVKEIEQNRLISEELRKELLFIYKQYKNINGQEIDKVDLKKRVDLILEKMFKTAFSFTIPMEFINTALGRMLLEIKLDMENTMMYGVSEITIVANKSRQMILNDYRSGKLKGIETGKKKRLLVSEEALLDYLTTVGRNTITLEEAKYRIKLFNKLNQKGLSEDKIRLEMYK